MSAAKRGLEKKANGKSPITTSDPNDVKAAKIPGGDDATRLAQEKQTKEREQQQEQDVLKSEHSKTLQKVLKTALRGAKDIDSKVTNMRRKLTIALDDWLVEQKKLAEGVTLSLDKMQLINVCYKLADYDSRTKIEGEPNTEKSQAFEMNVHNAIKCALVLHKHKTATMDEDGEICLPNNEIVPELSTNVKGRTIKTANSIVAPTPCGLKIVMDVFDKHFPGSTKKRKARQKGTELESKAGLFDMDTALKKIHARIRDMRAQAIGITMTPDQLIMLGRIVNDGQELIESMFDKQSFAERIIEADKDTDDTAVLVPATIKAVKEAYLKQDGDEVKAEAA